MNKSNKIFMHKCGLCGKTDVKDVALSRLQLYCGYGSSYDGELAEMYICGNCADKLYELMSNENNAKSTV